MGSSVQAFCPCGVEEEIMIGGGMLNFEETCLFPFCCEKCRSLVEANAYEENPICPGCGTEELIRYGDALLEGLKGENEVENWFDLTLTDGTYKCPKCEQPTLRFLPGSIHWD